jgi:hypothetical protein
VCQQRPATAAAILPQLFLKVSIDRSSRSFVSGSMGMKKPARMEVVRSPYELWEKAGQPEGRDQEFYHQAERELEGDSEDRETPEDV